MSVANSLWKANSLGSQFLWRSQYSQMQFNDVLIVQHMVAFHGLAVVHSRTPDACRLESLLEIAMDQGSHRQNRAAGGTGKRGLQIRRLTRLASVNADHGQEPENRGR